MRWRPKSYDLRYRVGRLAYYIPPEPPDAGAIGDGEPTYDMTVAFVEDVREYNNRGMDSRPFKLSPYGRYKKKITDAGATAVEQVGVIMWLNHEDAIEKIDELIAQGWELQQ